MQNFLRGWGREEKGDYVASPITWRALQQCCKRKPDAKGEVASSYCSQLSAAPPSSQRSNLWRREREPCWLLRISHGSVCGDLNLRLKRRIWLGTSNIKLATIHIWSVSLLHGVQRPIWLCQSGFGLQSSGGKGVLGARIGWWLWIHAIKAVSHKTELAIWQTGDCHKLLSCCGWARGKKEEREATDPGWSP